MSIEEVHSLRGSNPEQVVNFSSLFDFGSPSVTVLANHPQFIEGGLAHPIELARDADQEGTFL